MFLSCPKGWAHKKSRKDAGVLLLWFFPCALPGGTVVLNFSEHLNSLVKSIFPRFHPPRLRLSTSWGKTRKLHLEKNPRFTTLEILSLSVVPFASLHQCGSCWKTGPCLCCLLLYPYGLASRKGGKCSPASPNLQSAHESPVSLWKCRFSFIQSGGGSKSLHF